MKHPKRCMPLKPNVVHVPATSSHPVGAGAVPHCTGGRRAVRSSLTFHRRAVFGIVYFGLITFAHADEAIDVGRGPVMVHIPPSYDPQVPMPLLVALHATTLSADFMNTWMNLAPVSDEMGFLYAYPDGMRNRDDIPFWNATGACCVLGIEDEIDGSIDEPAYLRRLMEAIQARYRVDPRRVYFVGHSSGGATAHRMACESAPIVAAFANMAGSPLVNFNNCLPTAPVHALQIHGTNDESIPYSGGTFAGEPVLSAFEAIQQWADHNACASDLEGAEPGCRAGGTRREAPNECDLSLGTLDLVADLPSDETMITRLARECRRGGSAELWTLRGAPHIPEWSDAFSPTLMEWFLAHPKTDCNGNDVPDDQDITAGVSTDCNGNGFPDECESDCNDNGVADTCDIAAGTSRDDDGDGSLDECKPKVVPIALGSSATTDTLILPFGQDAVLNTFPLDMSQDVSLIAGQAVMFTPSTSRRGAGGFQETPVRVGLTGEGGGRHTVLLDPSLRPGVWTKVTMTVVGPTGGVATITLWVANQPGDINQDGTTDMADATAFGEEWDGARRLRLLDLNGDGVVDVRDATTFGRIWSGIRPDATQPWANTSLPDRPR